VTHSFYPYLHRSEKEQQYPGSRWKQMIAGGTRRQQDNKIGSRWKQLMILFYLIFIKSVHGPHIN
jgi:hypothetical protein